MERNGNPPERDASAKVHGSVHRINDPAVARVRALDDARFFGADGMCRECTLEPFDNQFLTRDIGASHNVFLGLVLDVAQVVLEFKAKSPRLFRESFCNR